MPHGDHVCAGVSHNTTNKEVNHVREHRSGRNLQLYTAVEAAVKALQKLGGDMQKRSIVGRE